MTARAFSTGSDFSAGGLRHWAHLLRKRGVASATSAAPAQIRLARVERSLPSATAASITIEVGGARVSVPSGFDEATTRAVLAALLDGAARVAR